ncbi:hypothetical protein MBLNU457_5293t1 [Dothideomycetes sp. NU457]
MPLTFLDLPVEVRLLVYDYMMDDFDTGAWTQGFCYEDGQRLRLDIRWKSWLCMETCCCEYCKSHDENFGQHHYYPPGFALPIRADLLNLALVCQTLCAEIIPTLHSRTKLVLHRNGLDLLGRHTRHILARFPGCESFTVLQINLNCGFYIQQVEHIHQLLETCFKSVRELRLHLGLDLESYPREYTGFQWPSEDFSVIGSVPVVTRSRTEKNLRALCSLLPSRVNIKVEFSDAEMYQRNYAVLGEILAGYQQTVYTASDCEPDDETLHETLALRVGGS